MEVVDSSVLPRNEKKKQDTMPTLKRKKKRKLRRAVTRSRNKPTVVHGGQHLN